MPSSHEHGICSTKMYNYAFFIPWASRSYRTEILSIKFTTLIKSDMTNARYISQLLISSKIAVHKTKSPRKYKLLKKVLNKPMHTSDHSCLCKIEIRSCFSNYTSISMMKA
ncbi:hypothetical protein AMTRI_Chr08g164390 [Amborella trichopoda]